MAKKKTVKVLPLSKNKPKKDKPKKVVVKSRPKVSDFSKIEGFREDGKKAVYTDGEILKIGITGEAKPAGKFYGSLSRGDARKARKAVRASGHPKLAGVSRISF